MRTDFPTSGIHVDDHETLHKAHNLAIYADDEPDIQTALNKAQQYKRSRVVFTPGKTYQISQALVVPVEVTLDGGGYGFTSLAPYATHNRARLLAAEQLDEMIKLSHFSGVRGCWLDGAGQATGGIFGQDTFYNAIEDNFFTRFTSYGLKFGGCLFSTIKRNGFSLIAGYALDALRSYGNTGYYGINVGVSELNNYQGAVGAIRLEGILTSISDDFEAICNGGPIIQVAGTVQSNLDLISPYFELKPGVGEMIAIDVLNSGSVSVQNCRAYGSTEEQGAIFMRVTAPHRISVTNSIIARFATVFMGTMTSSSDVSIFGNRYENYSTLNGFDLTNANSSFCIWPGDKVNG